LDEINAMHTPPNSVMTVKEVADYLRVNQRTVYRLAVERRLPGFKVGANWRFKRGDIDGWIGAQASAMLDDEAGVRRGDKKA
jgi:excisionase family DNA binding protein